MCYLLASAPPLIRNACCVSGARGASAASLPNIGGTWYDRNGAWAYQFTQNGNKFTWVRNPPEKASGTMTATPGSSFGFATLAANWGTGAGNGRVVAVDASNLATRIQWDNGEVFLRSAGNSPRPPNSGPMLNGYLVDWCLHWAADCGKPAADEYCKRTGHAAGATSFHTASMRPTLVLGDGKTCDAPTDCQGFTDVQCAASAPPPPGKGSLTAVWTLNSQYLQATDWKISLIDDSSSRVLSSKKGFQLGMAGEVCFDPGTASDQQYWCGANQKSSSTATEVDIWFHPWVSPGGPWHHAVELKATISNHATKSISGSVYDGGKQQGTFTMTR